MGDNQSILNGTVNLYLQAFNSYQTQFLQWGEWFFYTAVTITIVWLCLWRAFDQHSFQESVPKFIKEFFIIAFFYTIMINSGTWLQTIANSIGIMGTTIAHFKVSPSDLVGHGVALGNVLLAPIQKSGLLDKIIGALICAFAYAVVLFVFIYVAIDVALTTIAISFFISVSGFLLAFSAFEFTRSVARKTLDLVIAQCFKLLTLYIVVAAGSNIFNTVTQLINNGQGTFDIYGWAVAASVLFWSVSKYIPGQSARILSEVIHEHRGGAEAAALAMAATQIAKTAIKTASPVVGAAGNLAKIASGAVYNAAGHFGAAKVEGGSFAANIGAAASGAWQDLKDSTKGTVSDHFKHLQSKMTGGEGVKQRTPEGKELPIPGVANRMHHAAKAVRSDLTNSSGSGNPSSSGRTSAAPSKTRSQSTGDSVSRPKK